MGLRFRKSIKILPGVKLNLNKKSSSITFGGKGVHYTINSKGKRTGTIGIPGTGLSYTETSTKRKCSNSSSFLSTKSNTFKGRHVAIISILCMLFIGGLSSNNNTENNIELTETEIATTEETPTETIYKTLYTTTRLNVRNGPGTNYDIIDTIESGETVQVISDEANWARILSDSEIAYVSLKYLSDSKPISNIEETSSQNEGPYVWIPYKGKKYHSNSSCSGMKGASQVTQEQALRRGYTPCSKCY